MSQQQFNIAYRPNTLSRCIGFTEESATALLSKVANARAILITGSTGVGKTTLALALANEIASSPDSIIEINCISSGNIEDIRNLLEISGKRTLSGGRRVIILDEVHGLSAKSAGSLLKPLENPDPGAPLWIMLTNQPEILLPTLRNRCMKITPPAWTQENMLKLAKRVAKKSGVAVPKDVSRFDNPRDLLTYMGMDNDGSAVERKPSHAAKVILSSVLNNAATGGNLYSVQISDFMAISLAIRYTAGVALSFEKPDPDLLSLVRKADPKTLCKVAHACSVVLQHQALPPMILLDIFMGNVLNPSHFE